MAILKAKEIMKMSVKDMEEKVKELRSELIKVKVGNKTAKSNPREIKRTIAKILTVKNINAKNKEAKK